MSLLGVGDTAPEEKVYGGGAFGRQSVSDLKDWGTPPHFIAALLKLFPNGIDLDPCSNQHSLVPSRVNYALPETDGLRSTWNYPVVYVNPPYGRDPQRGTTIKDWVWKCQASHERYGSEVVALIPVATNTAHWKEFIWGKAAAICFVAAPRFKFYLGGREHTKGAPMAVAAVYWGARSRDFLEVFKGLGAVVIGASTSPASEPMLVFRR